jgi:hypothetical protein
MTNRASIANAATAARRTGCRPRKAQRGLRPQPICLQNRRHLRTATEAMVPIRERHDVCNQPRSGDIV